MKKGILVLSVFASLFFTSCEDKLLENEETNETEKLFIDKGDVPSTGDKN